jgi:predicted PolB exonuclease-like 3'-5' exonuclease
MLRANLWIMIEDEISVIMKDLFPVVKKDCEDFINSYEEKRNDLRSFLSGKMPMGNIDFMVDVLMLGRFGNTFEKSQEVLKRIFILMPAKKRYGNKERTGIDDADIARARELPITDMVKVRAHTTLCLWHDDKTPSMHVYADNHAYCFVCNKRADAIDFWMEIKGLDFMQAVKDMLHL